MKQDMHYVRVHAYTYTYMTGTVWPWTHTWDMHRRASLEVSSSDVAIESHHTITLHILPNGLWVCEVLHTVTQDVGMACVPLPGLKLHDWYEPPEIVYFNLWVVVVPQSREVKQFGSLREGRLISIRARSLSKSKWYSWSCQMSYHPKQMLLVQDLAHQCTMQTMTELDHCTIPCTSIMWKDRRGEFGTYHSVLDTGRLIYSPTRIACLCPIHCGISQTNPTCSTVHGDDTVRLWTMNTCINIPDRFQSKICSSVSSSSYAKFSVNETCPDESGLPWP